MNEMSKADFPTELLKLELIYGLVIVNFAVIRKQTKMCEKYVYQKSNTN